ncbi:uncharacterized [Tachysurus ichikawai]
MKPTSTSHTTTRHQCEYHSRACKLRTSTASLSQWPYYRHEPEAKTSHTEKKNRMSNLSIIGDLRNRHSPFGFAFLDPGFTASPVHLHTYSTAPDYDHMTISTTAPSPRLGTMLS